MWTTACPDWEQRIVEGRSLIPFEPLFLDEAEKALEVFKGLRVVDLPGRPTFGECCDEWVFDFVRAIFGAYDPLDAKRLVRDFFLLISKKNSKSTLAAGIMLTALIRNWRHDNELNVLAPTLEVANNSFGPAASMVRADTVLTDLLQVQDNFRKITHRNTGAFLKVIAADTETAAGKKTAFVLVDELWVFGKRANADAMLKEATGGLVSRAEGFVIWLSTQSDEPPAGVFKEKLDYFRDVRDGKIVDPKSLGVLYEYPAEMLKSEAYLDPKNFYITNPNIERSVSREWLADELVKAQRGDVKGLNIHLAKHLNIEIGMGMRANRWPGAEFWQRGEDKTLTREEILERSDVVVCGIDGGGLDDLFGFCLLGRCRETKRWLCWAHAWCHRSVLKRRKSIATILEGFEKDGDLTIVDDNLGDVPEIVEIVEEVKDRGLLVAVAADPMGIDEFVGALKEIDITEENGLLVGIKQGGALMNALKAGERALVKGGLVHCRSPLMDWSVGNLKIEPLATTIRATKQNAGDAKIDPAMAMFDAIAVMVKNPEAPGAFPKNFELTVWG